MCIRDSNHLAAVVVRVHVRDETCEAVYEERRIGPQVDVADVFGRIIGRNLPIRLFAFHPVDLVERIFTFFCVGNDSRVFPVSYTHLISSEQEAGLDFRVVQGSMLE